MNEIDRLRKNIFDNLQEIDRLNNIIDKQDRDITTLTKDKIKLKNIINELEKELDRGYRDLFEHELVPGRELIINIKNYLQELKEDNKQFDK